MIRDMASEMIKTLGYKAVLYADGQEALEYYRSHFSEIDLVVIDMIMPRLAGYNCFIALKAIHSDCRTLAISGYDANNEVQKMLEEGAKGFLHKPFTLAAFSKAVRDSLKT